MAPEQAAGHIRDLGPACDIYALGAILYECRPAPAVPGRHWTQTIEQVLHDEPAPRRGYARRAT